MSTLIEKIIDACQEEIDILESNDDLLARIEFMKEEALKINEDPFLYGFTVDEAKGYLRGISLISIFTKL